MIYFFCVDFVKRREVISWNFMKAFTNKVVIILMQTQIGKAFEIKIADFCTLYHLALKF